MGFISKIKEIYTYRHMLFTLVKQDINTATNNLVNEAAQYSRRK